MSKTPGFLFEVPEALLQGGLYIPLGDRVVLPGGAAMVHTQDADSAALFEELAGRDELFTSILMREPDLGDSGRLDLHGIGTLSLVADHKPQPDGSWITIVAGIGRVRLGEPYMLEGAELPRVDVEPAPVLCEDQVAARRRLREFSNIASGLGSGHTELVGALHRYAQEDADPSLSVDRLAGLVGVGDAALLQSFLDELDVMARLDMLDAQLLDYMVRVKSADVSRDPDGELD